MAKINKDLEDGNKLLKEQAENVEFIKDAYRSMVEMLKDAIEESIDAMQGLDDMGARIAKSSERELVSSFKKLGNQLEKNVTIQAKILKGQNVSKDIENQRIAITARLIQHTAKIRNNISLTAEAQETLVAETEEQAKHAEDALDSLEKQNTNQLKGISLFKVAGGALGGMADKLDKTGTLSGILKGNFEEVVTLARLGELAAVHLMSSFAKGVMDVNKQTVGIEKNMGLSSNEAKKFREEMAISAALTGTTKVNSYDTLKTVQELNAQFGTAATTIRKDIVGEMALLGKYAGLSAESQGSFAAFAMKSGIHAKEITRQSRAQVVQSENEYGVRLDINKTLDEAGQITGVIRANLGFNIVAISGAIAKAKQFGMTLQDLAGISANLLDFHSSIEAELTAELFTGKQLNLERARLFALTGDYKGLTEEIKANAGGELEFARMNVLQKEKLAAALGMSADQMSDMVYDQANLASLAEQARAIGDDELAQSLEKRDIQAQFNDLMVKAQTIIVDIAAGPLGDFAKSISNLLEDTRAVYGLLGLLAVVKLGGLVGGVLSLASALSVAGVASLATMSAITLGVGIAAIAAGIIYGTGVMNKEKKKAATIRRYNTLGAQEMVTLDKGSAMFDAGETVVRTDNFAKLTDGINELIGVTQANKPPKPWAKWETATLYR